MTTLLTRSHPRTDGSSRNPQPCRSLLGKHQVVAALWSGYSRLQQGGIADGLRPAQFAHHLIYCCDLDAQVACHWASRRRISESSRLQGVRGGLKPQGGPRLLLEEANESLVGCGPSGDKLAIKVEKSCNKHLNAS
jgi:hypothetical protein